MPLDEITIVIKQSEVKEALEEYGYEATPQRIADIMTKIATFRYLETDEIIRRAIDALADEQDWQIAKL